MKTYSFDIFKCRVTISIEKRKYETIDRLETAKELVKSQPGEIKMEENRQFSDKEILMIALMLIYKIQHPEQFPELQDGRI